MAILFEIIRKGSDYSCTADDGAAFYVGRRVPYEGHVGLYNIFSGSKLEKLIYLAADYAAGYGFWSTFIEPTAICEGRNFLTLNTYDSAGFTFGFAQFAAHVENGDFVRYFRAMLQMADAASYFPHLAVVNGHVCRVEAGAPPVELENAHSSDALKHYLNPTSKEVEDPEVIAAAKLIHWTSRSAAARDAQVAQMVATFRGFVKAADSRIGIDGRTADQCCAIADIRHQGRGTWPEIEAGLKSSKPFDALIAIGAPKWDDRKKKLKAAIQARPEFAAKRWSRAKTDFI